LNHAAAVLADTTHGLSGSKIVEICNAWAVDHNVNTPHASYPFDASNKRTALFENLVPFEPDVQLEILLDLCDRIGSDSQLDIEGLRSKILDHVSATTPVIPSGLPPVPRHGTPFSLDPEIKLKVFLCHASEDKPQVLELYEQLKRDGFDPWLDQKNLLPGQHWETAIPNAVRQAHVVIACVSARSTTKEGYVQKEMKFALDVADEKPEGMIFLIPARLEDCRSPQRLGHLHRVDLFAPDGYELLKRSLEQRLDAMQNGG